MYLKHILFCGLTAVMLCSFAQLQTTIITPEALGKILFFDPILSGNKTISCASCHNPNLAFADSVAFSIGVNGFSKRNTPSVMNMSQRTALFWDGRAATLENQSWFPIQDSTEMNLSKKEAVFRLRASTNYTQLFKQVYNTLPTAKNIAQALAAYERTLESTGSPFDAYMRGNATAVSDAAIRGHKLFVGKAKCFDCHFGPDFTIDDFKNIGLYNGTTLTDKGRYNITKNKKDIGKFKVPGLRNVSLTGPYMHNGMFANLRAVVNYYNNPTQIVHSAIGTDDILAQPLNLSNQECEDLVAFMNTLTDIKK
ncbi:MAG: cytochrome-c peroxidase [Bacteroidia bacterium]|nr:cytochrome-c peroxidase [Bacteroidia bacterium]